MIKVVVNVPAELRGKHSSVTNSVNSNVTGEYDAEGALLIRFYFRRGYEELSAYFRTFGEILCNVVVDVSIRDGRCVTQGRVEIITDEGDAYRLARELVEEIEERARSLARKYPQFACEVTCIQRIDDIVVR